MQRSATEGRKIREHTADQLVDSLGNLLKHICTITGLKIEDAAMLPFTKTFMRFLATYYADLTVQEIGLAFELNAANELPTKTVCYGSNMTLDYIGGVLASYKDKRIAVATKIAHSGETEIDDPPLTPEELKKDEEAFAEDYYQKYLTAQFSRLSLEYAHQVYDILDQRGVIALSTPEKVKYFEEANRIREVELSAPAISRKERLEQSRLLEGYLNEQIPKDEEARVKNLAKRLVLLDFFKAWKAEGKTHLFDDEKFENHGDKE